MVAGRAGEPGQVGGHSPVELIGCQAGVMGGTRTRSCWIMPRLSARPEQHQVSDRRVRLSRQRAADTARHRARTDGALPYGRGMAKAARILAALKRDGWIETRRSGSHRVLVKGDQQRIWAYHDGVDLGGPALARIARDYGYTVDELRKL